MYSFAYLAVAVCGCGSGVVALFHSANDKEVVVAPQSTIARAIGSHSCPPEVTGFNVGATAVLMEQIPDDKLWA